MLRRRRQGVVPDKAQRATSQAVETSKTPGATSGRRPDRARLAAGTAMSVAGRHTPGKVIGSGSGSGAGLMRMLLLGAAYAGARTPWGEEPGLAGVGGVAVRLLLPLAGGDAGPLAAAGDATVAFADSCADAAEDLTVLVTPPPDADKEGWRGGLCQLVNMPKSKWGGHAVLYSFNAEKEI